MYVFICNTCIYIYTYLDICTHIYIYYIYIYIYIYINKNLCICSVVSSVFMYFLYVSPHRNVFKIFSGIFT